MALEQLNNDELICWDSDGRLNVNIVPSRLHLTTVAEALSQIDNFQTIKAIRHNADFKQYCKLNDGLYLNNDEAKALRTKSMRTATAARNKPTDAIIVELKKYLKEQGFVYDRGEDLYYAPTNNLPENQLSAFPELQEPERFSWQDDREYPISSVSVRCKGGNNPEISFRIFADGFKMDSGEHDLILTVNALSDEGHQDRLDYKIEVSQKGLEEFKAKWEQYKASLSSELSDFHKHIAEVKAKAKQDTPMSEIYRKVDAANLKLNKEVRVPLIGIPDKYKMYATVRFNNRLDAKNNYRPTYSLFYILANSNNYNDLWNSGFHNNRTLPADMNGITSDHLNAIFKGKEYTNIDDLISDYNKAIETFNTGFEDAMLTGDEE